MAIVWRFEQGIKSFLWGEGLYRAHCISAKREKKNTAFNGGSSTYPGAEKAYIYEHLGGEARQEIKYRTQADRLNPICVLEILQEIYRQPQSLTKLQKQFFDRRQRHGECGNSHMH